MYPTSGIDNHSLDVFKEIHKLTSHLPKDSSLRDMVQELSDGNVLPFEREEELLSILERPPYGPWWKFIALRQWREQAIAIWALGHLQRTPEKVPDIVQTLRAILHSKPSGKNEWLRVRLISGVMLAAAVAIGGLGFAINPYLLLLYIPLFYAWAGAVPLGIALEDNNHCVIRKMASWSLSNLPTLPSIESLIEVSLGNRSNIRQCARHCVVRALPALTTEHYGQLETQTVPNLCQLLQSQNLDLILQVLVALGKVGDGRAIRTVEDLSKRGRSPQIRQEAEAVLPILKERQRLAEAPRNLLRASEQPAASPEVLLRPALDTGDSQPEQLLRASSSSANAE